MLSGPSASPAAPHHPILMHYHSPAWLSLFLLFCLLCRIRLLVSTLPFRPYQVSYNDIVATHVYQTLLYLVVMACALLGASFLVSSFLLTLEQVSMARNEYEKRMEYLESYMTSNGLPEDLRKNIFSYFDYLWHSQKGVEEDKGKR